jgi:GGDEF domain-containing protein
MSSRAEFLLDVQRTLTCSTLTVLALDADQHFRQINREDGRAAGDSVLAAVQEALRLWSPAPAAILQDGDNFLAAFVDVDLGEFVREASEVRRHFSERTIAGVSRPLDVRVGIAQGSDGAQAGLLVELAEATLRLAQTSGQPIEVVEVSPALLKPVPNADAPGASASTYRGIAGGRPGRGVGSQ